MVYLWFNTSIDYASHRLDALYSWLPSWRPTSEADLVEAEKNVLKCMPLAKLSIKCIVYIVMSLKEGQTKFWAEHGGGEEAFAHGVY